MKKKIDQLKLRFVNKIGVQRAEKLAKIWRVARVVKNVVCWIIIVVLVFVVISFLLSRVNGGTPSVFGYTLQRVETGSMEPALHVEDVILSKEIKDEKDIQVGDIVTFRGDSNFDNRRVTHRVSVAPYIDDEGDWVIITKGDANAVDDGAIKLSKVMSKMVRKMELLRHLYSFFFSPWGLIIFIGMLLLIFFDEVMNLIHLTPHKYDEPEEQETIGEIIERIRREDREEEKRKAERNKRMERRRREALASAEDEDLETLADKQDED